MYLFRRSFAATGCCIPSRNVVISRRTFIFRRGVGDGKGAFIGNFPVAAESDQKDFHNNVPFLLPDASAADASVFLQKYDVGCVPVLSNDSKDLIGMFSERDLARAIAGLSFSNPRLPELPRETTPVGAHSHLPSRSKGANSPPPAPTPSSSTTATVDLVPINFHEIKVEDLMSKNVISIIQGTSLSEALLIMDQNNIRHLAVVSAANQKHIVGLLSMRDIMHRHLKGESQATTEDFMQWVLKMSS
jgi:CBS domain-containing protein